MAKEITAIITPKFRVAFPNVFKAQSFQGKEKFVITMLFPKDTDISALKALAKAAAVAKWGPDTAKWPRNIDLPFRDGDEKPEWGGFPGNTYVRAASQYKPGLVDANNQEIISEGDFYGGCYAIAQVNCYAWEYMGKNGVSFGLMNVKKVADGEQFSGRQDAATVFGAMGGTEAAPPAEDIFS